MCQLAKEERESRRTLAKQEGAQLSNYSAISSNSRLIVNCSSVPATRTASMAGGSSPAALLPLLGAEPSWRWRDVAPSSPRGVSWRLALLPHPVGPPRAEERQRGAPWACCGTLPLWASCQQQLRRLLGGQEPHLPAQSVLGSQHCSWAAPLPGRCPVLAGRDGAAHGLTSQELPWLPRAQVAVNVLLEMTVPQSSLFPAALPGSWGSAGCRC